MQQSQVSNEHPQRKFPRKIFYGWYIIAAGCISGFFNQGIFTIGLSAFIPPVQKELGWSLTAISLGFSIKQFEQGLLGPISGYLIDRLGPRLMCSIGSIIAAIGLILFGRMDSFTTFYTAAIIIALGQSVGTIRAYMATLVHWFVQKRGLAAAIIGSGLGMGYAGVYPIALLLEWYGWRNAAYITALVFLSISLPLAQIIRHRPQQMGLQPDGASQIPEKSSAAA